MPTNWESTFDELVRERYSRLVGFATILAGSGDADDLVQEALIATFSRTRRFPSVGHAEQYVRRAIASKSVDAHRKRTRQARREQAASPRDSLADHAEAVAADRDLAAFIGALPPRIRACIVLRYLDDASVRETAAALGISEGAVKRYVSDGLGLLKAQLGDITLRPGAESASVDNYRGGAR